MKRYEGRRTIDGIRVTVNGQRLDEHVQVRKFTNYGFEWSYEGDSPRQLALAILADYLGDETRALDLSEGFMKEVIANLDNDWTLTIKEIDQAVRQLKKL